MSVVGLAMPEAYDRELVKYIGNTLNANGAKNIDNQLLSMHYDVITYCQQFTGNHDNATMVGNQVALNFQTWKSWQDLTKYVAGTDASHLVSSNWEDYPLQLVWNVVHGSGCSVAVPDAYVCFLQTHVNNNNQDIGVTTVNPAQVSQRKRKVSSQGDNQNNKSTASVEEEAETIQMEEMMKAVHDMNEMLKAQAKAVRELLDREARDEAEKLQDEYNTESRTRPRPRKF
jgi:hypothetical protein